MRTNILKIWILIGGLFLLMCATKPTEDKPTIALACAANMLSAMDSIAVIFEEETGIHCEITTGSSGMLAGQIENGAPYDLFISADTTYPQLLFQNGRGGTPFIYAQGRLVLVTPKNSIYKTIEEALFDPRISRIGIADSQQAPYGIAANQYLKKRGIKKGIEERLITGESIGQINHYLRTGTVDAGFTSYSFRVENKNDFQYFEVDKTMFAPINQGAMILNHGKNENKTAAESLKNYFSSHKCKQVLIYFGYLVN